MARVIRTEQAQADLEGIFDYLDSQSEQAAEHFAERFDAAGGMHDQYSDTDASSEDLAPTLESTSGASWTPNNSSHHCIG
jgi:hypothetical protein